MIKEVVQTEQINTNADASIKGIGLQKIRAAERLLRALLENRRAVFCIIEHIDDVLEVDVGHEIINYTAEQDKSYSTDFSMNSHEVKNALRIFFDTWYNAVEASENIRFVFYTNTNIKKEKRVGVLKEIEEPLPKEPLLRLLCEKKYAEAFPFVLPIFKEYYLEQHKKHIKKDEDIKPFEKILYSTNEEKWKKFFDLIEWNFGQASEIEVRKNVEKLVGEICLKYSVNEKYISVIVAQMLDMIESRKFEEDFLCRFVHVAEIKSLFLEFAQEAKIQEKLDPMYEKWDDIQCDDIRNINEKFLSVCPAFEKDSLEEFEEEYIDGAYEQSHHQNHRQVKAYNYRVYKTCQKNIKKFIKERNCDFSQDEIEVFIEELTYESYNLIRDKAKTYDVAFEDQDMIRKTIIMLFQECYLSLDEGRKVDE